MYRTKVKQTGSQKSYLPCKMTENLPGIFSLVKVATGYASKDERFCLPIQMETSPTKNESIFFFLE